MIFLILRNNDPEKWITVGLIFLSLIILFLSIRYVSYFILIVIYEYYVKIFLFFYICFIKKIRLKKNAN